MTPVSAALIVKDEAQDLPAALESVAFCDEILVVDGGSKDRTPKIAEATGARVVVKPPFPGFRDQRDLGARQARYDWVLSLDGDERVSPRLPDEILALRSVGFTRAGYRMPRAAFYLGRWIRGTDWYPDLQLRVFDRRQGGWKERLVHEQVHVRGPVGRLRGEIMHYPYADISEHLQTIDSDTSLWARRAFAAGRRTGMVETLLVTAAAFLRNYFIRRGFLLGRAGITISLLNTFCTFGKFAKLQEQDDRVSGPPRR